jgi:uncharacterized protein
MSGFFLHNLVHFARVLRAAGVQISPHNVIDAQEAIATLGFADRADMKACLRAIFIKQHDQLALFDEAFDIFWRKRGVIEKLIAAMGPQLKKADEQKSSPRIGARRLAEAFQPRTSKSQAQARVEFDARLTTSDIERLQSKDFEQMSADELMLAQKALAHLHLPDDLMRVRRMMPTSRQERIDPRAMVRAMMRTGGHSIELRYRTHRTQPPPIVALCDISGSMNDYTRMFLHFLHALSAQGRVVHGFLFGTRLTNVTRALRARDIDDALARCSQAVPDWNGGTRIGSSIAQFNRQWARRVLGQGAHVILFTDGLERDGVDVLSTEMERLSKLSQRLIWLNPLLRYDHFEPKARGIVAMLPHVDDLRAAHNIVSFVDLIEALSRPLQNGLQRQR